MLPILSLANEAYRQSLSPSADLPRPPSRLIAARRDRAAFQVILCPSRPYSLQVSTADHFSARHAHMEGQTERYRIAVEAPVPVTLSIEEFLPDDDRAEKADILLTCDARESCAGVPSAVWVDLEVPADAPVGTHTVTVLLYASMQGENERLVQKEALTLCISPFVAAKPTERSFHLDLWQHASNIARVHDTPLWSDAHFAVLERYVRTLAELGQSSVTVIASEIPWRGQSCYTDMAHRGDLYEYSMIGVVRERSGELRYDFSPMQRYIDLCDSYGICKEIEVFGLLNIWNEEALIPQSVCPDYPDPILVRYLDRADGCMKYLHTADEIEGYIRAIEAYFVSTGQISRVRIAADEPADVERFRTCMERLSGLAPRFRYKVAINHASFIGEFGDRISDFAPYLRCVEEERERLAAFAQADPDKRFLWYVCCGSARPNTFLRNSPLEARMIGVMTELLGMHGFLRWSYTAYPQEPRKDIRYRSFEAGDCNLVYPAYNGDVMLSLRYKNLQRGLDDYAYIQEAKRKDAAAVAELIEGLLETERAEMSYNAIAFPLDWERFSDFKEKLLQICERG